MPRLPNANDTAPPKGVRRVAELHLRAGAGLIAVPVLWPLHRALGSPPPLVILASDRPLGGKDDDGLAARLCAALGTLTLEARSEADTVLAWAADHAGELGADPTRIIVAGRGAGATTAAGLAAHASTNGWPTVAHQALLLSDPDASPPAMASAGAARVPATVLGPLESSALALGLRAAGIPVEELITRRADDDQALRALTRSLRANPRIGAFMYADTPRQAAAR